MKRFWKITGGTLGGVVLIFLSYLGLLIYPSVLFANSVQYNSLTVYSDGDLIGAEGILRDIERALETSEIYDATISHQIYFGDGNRPFTLIQDLTMKLVFAAIGRGSSPSYNLSFPPYISQSITFYRPIIETNSLVHPDGSGRVNQNLARTLTHEVVHTFLRQNLGLDGVATAPMWKQEGYADYIAASTTILADPTYDIAASVERISRQDLSWLIEGPGNYRPMTYGCIRFGILEDEEGRRWNTCYYIARVLVEYLLDVKGMAFSELMRSEVSDTGTLEELFAAYDAGELQ
jgi:hypothetical protein